MASMRVVAAAARASSRRASPLVSSHGGAGSLVSSHGGAGSLVPLRGGAGSIVSSHGGAGSLVSSNGGAGSLVSWHGGAGSLVSSPGGAGSLVPLRSGAGSIVPFRGGAGSLIPLRGGVVYRVPFRGAAGFLRGMSTASNGQAPFWSWKTWRLSAQAFIDRVKAADDVWKVAYTLHGVIYLFFTTAAGYAIWYVDGCVSEERRRREIFQRTAVSGHQEHVGHTIASVEKLQEKINVFWDKFLTYREDDMQYRDCVTKGAGMLKKQGYVIVAAVDWDKLEDKVSEMTILAEELSKLKAGLEAKANNMSLGVEETEKAEIEHCEGNNKTVEVGEADKTNPEVFKGTCDPKTDVKKPPSTGGAGNAANT